MGVRHQDDIVTAVQQRPAPRQDPARPHTDRLDRLPEAGGRRPHRPLRVTEGLADLRGRPALVVAVVPLEQVRVGLGVQPRQLRGASGALERAAQHERRVPVAQDRRQSRRPLLALRREGHVGASRVPAVAAPHGLAMAHDEDAACSRGHAS